MGLIEDFEGHFPIGPSGICNYIESVKVSNNFIKGLGYFLTDGS